MLRSLDVSDDEVVDWRDSAVDKGKLGSFGTNTHSSEDGKTTVVKEVKSGVSPVDLQDFSHLQKFRMNPLVKISLSLQSAQLVSRSAGNQELQSAQLCTGAPCDEEAVQAMPVKKLTTQQERQHRPAGIVEIKPRRKRQVKIEQEIPVVPPGYPDVFTMSVDAGVSPEGISRNGSIMVKNSPESRIMITTASTAGARAHFQDKTLSSRAHRTIQDHPRLMLD